MEKSNIKVLNIYNLLPLIKINNGIKITTTLIEDIEKGLSDSGLEGKEKETIIKSRVNQSKFRQQLLDRYKKCCRKRDRGCYNNTNKKWIIVYRIYSETCRGAWLRPYKKINVKNYLIFKFSL